MKVRRYANWDFEYIGSIEPERGPDGELLEFMPQSRYLNAKTTPLNGSGTGPFCRFRIGQGQPQAGLYIMTFDGIPVYAGECANLAVRWGLTQYGSISPKNCFRGGQSTNCLINASILAEARRDRLAELWFCPLTCSIEQRRSAETVLIKTLRPEWNRTKLK